MRVASPDDAWCCVLAQRDKEKGKEEDQRIAAYLRNREKREQELQQEKERVKAEKERETAR